MSKYNNDDFDEYQEYLKSNRERTKRPKKKITRPLREDRPYVKKSKTAEFKTK